MCAINGISGSAVNVVERMNMLTRHRGPDGEGVMDLGAVTLGHNRLSIIDTSDNGAQPMLSADRSCVLVFNGEIYNFRDLKAELSTYPYTSQTDSEVILAAYNRWGIECVKKFNGIFAFALYDKQKDTLFLARDPFGVKPLYYSHHDDKLAFSSEIKALLETLKERTLNTDAFQRFMFCNHVTGGEQLIKGVHEFPPGHIAEFSSGKLTIKKYFTSDFSNVISRHTGEYLVELRQTVDQAVKRQLISDRPIGLLLSGGIDSSTVLATASREIGSVKTYTTSFDRETSNVDAKIASRTAAYFGAEHTEIRISNDDVITLLDEAVWYLDAPTNSATVVSQLGVAKQVHKSVAVLLGGDGGDELFGGYDRYRLALAAHYFQLLPSFFRVPLTNISKFEKLNKSAGYEQFKLFYTGAKTERSPYVTTHLDEVHVKNFYREEFGDLDSVPYMTRLLEIDRRLLRFGSLMRSDKMFMASGIEARVPLLDLELARLADTISPHDKVSLFKTKRCLKVAMADRLPEYLFDVKKRGWVSPVGTWMREPKFQDYLQSVLSADYYTGTRTLFNWSNVHSLIERQRAGEANERVLLWSLLTFQVWARKFNVTI